MDNRIYRSRETKMIAGVCGGVADMFNIDPTLVRLVAVALTIFSGFTFLLVYFLCAIIIPLEPSPGYILRRHQQPASPTGTSNRMPVNPASGSAGETGAAQPVEEVPVQTVSEDTLTPVEHEPAPIQPAKSEIPSEEQGEYRNDETVINTQADKY